MFKNKQEKQLSPTEQIKQIERQLKKEKRKTPKFRSSVAFVLALTLLVGGTTAYFTDTVKTNEKGTAGTLSVSIDDSEINLLNANGQDILNPGDVRNVAFTIENEGNKSTDAEVIITLISSVPMHNDTNTEVTSLMSLSDIEKIDAPTKLTEGNVYTSEYELFYTKDIGYVDGYGYFPKSGVEPLQSRAMDNSFTKIVYKLDPVVLSGNASLDETEKEWIYTPDTSNILMSYLKSPDYYYRYSYDDWSSYNENLGTVCMVEVYPPSGEECELTIIVPKSDYENDYVYLNNLVNAGAKSLCVSSDLNGFLYYENSTFTIFTAEEVQNQYGIVISYYNGDYKELIQPVVISELEYGQLSSEEQAKYVQCSDSKTYDLVLLFDPNSGNEFQNSNVSIKIEVRAKQHRNTTDNEWITTDSKLASIIQDTPFIIDYDELHRVAIVGVKGGVDQTALTDIVIPEGVEAIPGSFFYGNEWIESVTLPSTLTEIGSYAFYGCTNLTEITIPASVEYMGNSAFEGCTSLETVVIEDGLTEIPYGAFRGCTSLNSVTLPSTLLTIGNESFVRCSNLASSEIPDGVTYIDCAFVETGLTSVTIPNSVTYLSGYTFMDCADLTTATLSNQLTKIPSGLFQNCTKLETVIIDGYEPNCIDGNITQIGSVAFESTIITEIVIGDSVTYIENNAFRYCDKLTTITIGDNVTYIGYTAFRCSSTVATTVYTNNQEAIDFNWSRYYRTVTILPIG